MLKTEPVKDVMIAFRNVEEMISKAAKYVWILTNQILASTIPYLLSALERGAEFHLTMQKDYNPPKSIHDLVSNPTFTKAARNAKWISDFWTKCLCLCVSRKRRLQLWRFLTSMKNLTTPDSSQKKKKFSTGQKAYMILLGPSFTANP